MTSGNVGTISKRSAPHAARGAADTSTTVPTATPGEGTVARTNAQGEVVGAASVGAQAAAWAAKSAASAAPRGGHDSVAPGARPVAVMGPVTGAPAFAADV
jgi:hypothetical protein